MLVFDKNIFEEGKEPNLINGNLSSNLV